MRWIRLNVVAEGETEEAFVRDILDPALWRHSLNAIGRRVQTGRRGARIYRGGALDYSHFRREVVRWLKHEKGDDVRLTTMVDLFRIPSDFPGYAEAARLQDPIRRAELLEEHWARDINDIRFIPYVQVHEFEALIFSEPSQVVLAHPEAAAEAERLNAIRAGYLSPEHIDDGPATAPSKRIESLIPAYHKPTSGVIILRGIGLPRLRQECAHFNDWLTRIEECGRIG